MLLHCTHTILYVLIFAFGLQRFLYFFHYVHTNFNSLYSWYTYSEDSIFYFRLILSFQNGIFTLILTRWVHLILLISPEKYFTEVSHVLYCDAVSWWHSKNYHHNMIFRFDSNVHLVSNQWYHRLHLAHVRSYVQISTIDARPTQMLPSHFAMFLLMFQWNSICCILGTRRSLPPVIHHDSEHRHHSEMDGMHFVIQIYTMCVFMVKLSQ